MRLPLEVYIAARYIRANMKQSLIIMLAVGIGVSIIIFIPSINLSFFNYFLSKTIESSAHIRVTREIDTLPRDRALLHQVYPQADQILITDQTATRRRDIKAYRRLMDELLKYPGVVEAAPYISEQIIVVRGQQSLGATLQGIIPDREKNISNIQENIKQGDLDTLSTTEVFLGSELAEELGVQVGNRVQLVTPFGTRSYKVSGLLESGIYQQDLVTVILNLTAAQRLMDMPNEVTGIGLKVRDIYDASAIASRISQIYDVEARSWMEDNKVYLDQIANFRQIIAVISFLIVLAAASSITSVLIMVVSSKSKEIGILKAMGASPTAITRLFVLQALFLSILGAIAGLFGAMLLIALYNASPMSRTETFLGIGREPVTMNLEYTIYAIFYALLSSFLSSLIPAWRAGQLDPVKAINQ